MDKDFVRSIEPPLIDAVPQDIISELSTEFTNSFGQPLTTQSIRKILKGEWTRPDVVERAFELLKAEHEFIGKVLRFMPQAQAA